jgi:hypothetical protein
MKQFTSTLADSGWIDAASLYQVVDYFDQCKTTPHGYPWSRQTVVDLTTIFILTEYQQLAPSPQKIRSQRDIQSILVSTLLDSKVVTPLTNFDEKKWCNSKQLTHDWFLNPDGKRHLKKSIELTLADESFGSWIDWTTAQGALENHVRSHGSLIDTDTSELVGLALEISPRELQQLKELAANGEQVKKYANGLRDSSFNDMCAGYIASAMVRGFTHIEHAKLCNVQLTPHPFRENIALHSAEVSMPRPVLKVSNTCEALANVIIHIAIGEATTEQRLKLWVANIEKSRAILKDAWGYLAEQDQPEDIERSIHDFAKRAKFQFASTDTNTAIDWALGAGLGALVALYIDVPLSPIIGPMAGVIFGANIGALTNRAKISEKVSNSFAYLNSDSLRNCGSGIVKRRWNTEGLHVIS